MAKIFMFNRIKIPKIKSKGQVRTMRNTPLIWRNKMKLETLCRIIMQLKRKHFAPV